MRPFLPFLCIGALGAIVGCSSPAPAPAPPVKVDTLPAPPHAPRPLERFHGLLGAWTDSTGNARTRSYEEWKAAGDSMLLGFGYVLKGRDTVFFEDLKLEEAEGQLIYAARIDSQNNGDWVPFTALPGGPDSLVFENPGHDWPQCITYMRTATGGWEVVVSGTESGVQRQEAFHYKRR